MQEGQGLLIRIGADYSGVEKAVVNVSRTLSELEKRIQTFSNSFGNVIRTDGFARLNAEVKALKDNLSNIKVSDIKLPKVELRAISIPPIPNPFPAVEKGSATTIKSLGELQAQLKRFQGALQTSTNPDSIIRLNRAIEATKGRIDAISKMNGGGIEKVGKAATNSTQAVMNIGRVLQDLPYGLQGVANNIDPLVASLGGGAGLGVIVSAVTTGLLLFNKQLKEAFSGSGAMAGHVKKIAEAFKGAESEFAKASTMVNELRINVDLAKKGLLNKGEVVKQYNETLGKATGQVKNLDEAEQGLIKNGDAYVKMMLYKAAANTALEQAAAKAFEAEQKRRRALTEFESIGDRLGQGARNTVPDAPADLDTEIDKRAKQNAERRKKKAIKESTDAQNELEGIAKDFQKKAAEIAKGFKIDFFDFGDPKPEKDKPQFNFFDKYFSFDPNKLKLTDKQRNELLAAADAFSKEMGGVLDGVEFRKGTTNEGQVLENAKRFWADYQKGIIKLKPPVIEVDISNTPVVVNQPAGQWVEEYKKNLQQQFDKGLGEPIQTSFDLDVAASNITDLQASFREKFAAIGEGLPSIPIKLALDFEGQKDFLTKKLKEDIAKADLGAALGAAAASTGVQVAVDIGNGIADGIGTIDFGSMFDGFKEAFASGSFQDIFNGIGDGFKDVDFSGMLQPILNTLGAGVQELGKIMITAAPLIQAVKGLFTNPAGSLIAGIGLVALGGVIKNTAKNIKPTPFADGGIVSGPTRALIGEYAGARNNPEVVAPLSKLKDMIGGLGGGNFPQYLPVHRISGNDLLLWYERARGTQDRNY